MKVLGIDYGRKKVGLAIGETETGLVEPAGVIMNNQLTDVSEFSKTNKIDLVVLGIPDGKLAGEIKNFGKKLEKEAGLAVKFFDETLTTQDAIKILGQIGRKKKYKKAMEDAIAAAVMLKSYLERGIYV